VIVVAGIVAMAFGFLAMLVDDSNDPPVVGVTLLIGGLGMALFGVGLWIWGVFT